MLVDNYGRSFKYLRLSLTEKCNFSCAYCLPSGYIGNCKTSYLTIHEIENLISAFVELGIEKVRLTGGEPTLRSDLINILSVIKKHSQIKSLALTTNGFRLPTILPQLKENGLDAINISLDSLDSVKFKKICGSDYASTVVKSIEQAIKLRIPTVKVNTVLLKDINDDEFFDFMKFVQNKSITLRFIELMRTNDNVEYFKKHHLAIDPFKSILLDKGWSASLINKTISGPSVDYSHPQFEGKIGFISPYSHNFCNQCNRLRVSSQGGLRMCLFGLGDYSIRNLLQNSSQKNELINVITKTLKLKNHSHNLLYDDSGSMSNLSTIGG